MNLVNNYLVVGVTEELGDFVAVLEAALPRFFSGATDLYNSGLLYAFIYLICDFSRLRVYGQNHRIRHLKKEYLLCQNYCYLSFSL